MITLDSISPALLIFADMTGQTPSEHYVKAHLACYASRGLMAEAVNQAAGRIARDWDKSWWPSPEYVAQYAARIQRDVMDELHGIRPRTSELDDAAFESRERTWDARRARALEWYDAHLVAGQRIVADADREIDAIIARHPNGRMATHAEFRKAYRDGLVIGACLLELTREVHPKAAAWNAPAAHESLDARDLAA